MSLLRWLRAAALSPLLATAAHPVAADGGTVWVCGLSDDGVRLHCVADALPESGPAETAPQPAPIAGPRGAAGPRFPLDVERAWTVELWSPPTEAGFVQLLAQSTICYRTPECRVVLAPSAWLPPDPPALPLRVATRDTR